MYNLSEYSDNYSMTSGSLWNYYRDEMNYDGNENDANGNMANNKITTSKSFKYYTIIIGSLPNNRIWNGILNAEFVDPLKYLSKFWRSLDLPSTNCKIELDLSCSRYCVITEISRTFRAVPNTDPVRYELVKTANSVTVQIMLNFML